MKKLLSMLLTTAMLVSLSACDVTSTQSTDKDCEFDFLHTDTVEISRYKENSYFQLNKKDTEFDISNLEFISENPDIATFSYDSTALSNYIYYNIEPISGGETDVYIKCKDCGAESQRLHVIVDLPNEEATTETVVKETDTESSKEKTDGEYSIKFGEFLSAIENVIDEKNVIVIKAKIDSNLTNKLTIEQNYYNVVDLIRNQGCDKYDELQYWAVADMIDGSESKVISFTVDSDLIELIAAEKVLDNQVGDYVSDLWVLPSLQE